MINSKLLVLLRRLDANEFKELEKFVASPYHARGRDYISLFKILKPHYPDFDNDQLNRQNLFKKLYPDEKYSSEKSDHKLRMIFTALYKLCLDFLVQNAFDQDTKVKHYYLLNQLRLKKLYKEFENVYSDVTRIDLPANIHENPDRGGVVDLFRKYYLSMVHNNYSIAVNDFSNAFKSTLHSMENIIVAALMESYKFESLKNVMSVHSFSPGYTMINNLLESLDTEKLLGEMKKNNDKYYPYILIFYTSHKMNKNKDNPEYFHELKKLLIEHRDLFGRSQNYNFWNVLMTYFYSVDLPLEEIISIYDYMLKNNIFRVSDTEDFNTVLFRSIVCAYTSAGKIELLKNFIDKYSGELNIKHRENLRNLAYAHLNFSNGKFKEALDYATKTDYDIFFFKMDIRILLFQIYFELSYFEQAYSLIHSTVTFLKSTSEFSESKKKSHLTCFKYFKELLKLKSSNELQTYAIESLKRKITEFNFFQRQWTLKKIEEIQPLSSPAPELSSPRMRGS